LADDRWLFVAAPQSPGDALLADLLASLPASEHAIALAVVGSLDDRGFLTESPAAIARTMGILRSRADAVVAEARRLGPVGVATAGVHECLLAQLDALEARGIRNPVARSIVAEHLEDLGRHRHHAIARSLRIAVGDVERARAFIQSNLWPHPFAAVEEATGPDFRHYWVPDVAIRQVDEAFQVEVLQSVTRWLRVNPTYSDLARRAGTLDTAERTHVLQHVGQARTFIRNLRQREQTLRGVTEAIVMRQGAFLRSGTTSLVPLTRVQIARDVGFSASTVSRVVLDKVALLPRGDLWPFSDFFGGGQAAMAAIEELLASSDVPLTDEQLTEMLIGRGYLVTRRTVTSYRRKLGIANQRDRILGGRS
jgi:RNA polymerase sigma-54 factor